MGNYDQDMEYKYGEKVCSILNQYTETQRILAQQKQNLEFLLTCSDYGLTPNHLKNSTENLLSNKQLQDNYDKIELEFLQKVLDIEISEIRLKIETTTNDQRLHEVSIKATLSADDYKAFTTKQKEVFTDTDQEERQKNTQEIDQLKKSLWKTYNIKFNETWFVNTTKIDFPLEIQWLLSLGKDFALPVDTKSFPLFQLTVEGEDVIRGVEDKREQNKTRDKYRNMLDSFHRHLQHTSFAKYVLRIHREAIAFLELNNTILITETDKGHVTVAMDRTENNKKISKLLSDKTTFKLQRVNSTTRLQNMNNEFVEWLHEQNIITDIEKMKMTTYTGDFPSINGLPMIHTTNMLLRLISSSMHSSPCYELSKYVQNILQSANMNSELSIKNSFAFVEKLRNLKLKEHDVLVSFEMVSLFTDIPGKFAVDIVMEQWNKISKKTEINNKQFNEILYFCLMNNTYIQFNKKIYRQLQGLPMCSPLSLTISNLILDYLLDKCFKKIETTFIARYEDNIFAVMNHHKIDKMLRFLNQFNEKIKFSVKREENKAIEFLDVKIQREQDYLSFNWHPTESASGRLINFMSNQAKDIIINTASNLVSTVFALSDRKFDSENEKTVTKILTDNSFPSEVVSSLIQQYKHRIPHDKEEKKEDSISMLYIPELAESFEREIANKMKNVHIAYKSSKTLESLFTELNVN